MLQAGLLCICRNPGPTVCLAFCCASARTVGARKLYTHTVSQSQSDHCNNNTCTKASRGTAGTPQRLLGHLSPTPANAGPSTPALPAPP
jgi:hypothetical protein